MRSDRERLLDIREAIAKIDQRLGSHRERPSGVEGRFGSYPPAAGRLIRRYGDAARGAFFRVTQYYPTC